MEVILSCQIAKKYEKNGCAFYNMHLLGMGILILKKNAYTF